MIGNITYYGDDRNQAEMGMVCNTQGNVANISNTGKGYLRGLGKSVHERKLLILIL